MNEIFSSILFIALLVAAIFAGMVVYDDDPETPNWVKVSCAWACVLIGFLFLRVLFWVPSY